MRARLATLAAATVAFVAVLAPSTSVAAPTDSKIQLGSKAQFVATTTLRVPVTVTCPATFSTGFVFVSVTQSSTGGSGFGFMSPLTCTGDPTPVVVTVNGGPFTLGQALASATGGAGFADSDTRQIQIVL